jgi:hypothetical protein
MEGAYLEPVFWIAVLPGLLPIGVGLLLIWRIR